MVQCSFTDGFIGTSLVYQTISLPRPMFKEKIKVNNKDIQFQKLLLILKGKHSYY